MKWILILLAVWMGWRIYCLLLVAIPKVTRLSRLKEYEKSKDINVFRGLRGEPIIYAEKAVDDCNNRHSLDLAITEARDVIWWYLDEGFENCSSKELDSVIFYSILKNLAEQRLKNLE